MTLTDKTCAVIITATCIALGSIRAPAADGDDSTANGRDLYLSQQCWQCHGYEGQGGAAARIASVEYPFDAFALFVRYPNQMPAYPANLLSDEKLRLIYEYVRSIPEPPPLDDIPELEADRD